MRFVRIKGLMGCHTHNATVILHSALNLNPIILKGYVDPLLLLILLLICIDEKVLGFVIESLLGHTPSYYDSLNEQGYIRVVTAPP